MNAPKSPRQKFGGTVCVGAAISRPPTWQVFEQNRYTPTKPLMLQMYHVSTKCRRIAFANVWYCIVGALRRRYFPMGK